MSRTMAEFWAGLDQGRSAMKNARPVSISQTFEGGAPVPGTLAELEANRRQAHELPGVRDLRAPARRTTDQVWARAAADVQEKFGRRISFDSWEQQDPAQQVALRAARESEAAYIDLSDGGRVPTKAAADVALERFCADVAHFLNVATRGWLPRAQYEAEQRKAEEDRWR